MKFKNARLYIALCIAVISLSVVVPTRAYAYELPDFLSKWFPQWFGPEDNGPYPSKTLQAPFVKPGSVPKNPGASIGIPHRYSDEEDTGDLSKPHRTNVQVSEWLTRALAEVLTIDPDPTLLKVHFGRLKTGMSTYAIQQFRAFLTEHTVLDALSENKMVLKGVVNEQPLLLNEGVVEGRYRWLYQVDTTLTFMPKGTTSMDNPDIAHQAFTFVIQVGRVKEGVQGKAIETWQVKTVGERIYPNKKKR